MAESRCEIFCVGNAVADILARPVDALADPGASQPLDEVALGPGGNSVNTGVALARLGSRVRIAAALGNDRLGRMIREVVREKGVDDANLVAVDGFRTSTSLVLIQANGERRLLHFRGASAAFAENHIDWGLVNGAQIFHCASAFALPAFDGAPFERAIARAKRLGCLTSINVCWDTKNRWLPLLQPALQHADFIFPNVDEGYQLTGEREPAAIARRLQSHGVKTVVVKLGAAGCYVQGPSGSFTSPGFKVSPVDTTGAGDCFAAAFLAEISRGATLEEAARFANAAGALSTLGMGGADSAPTRLQVVEFMGRC
ncbi:MAG TPA: carbohydrate kinase family protein [Terriglobia bacterium]|nr:carbohydrate kinase family protein [Terriglobia bacterium]